MQLWIATHSAPPYWMTTMLPLSPCMRQRNVNVPLVVIATATSCALKAGMSPD
jgi:hypothetical protein